MFIQYKKYKYKYNTIYKYKIQYNNTKNNFYFVIYLFILYFVK